MKNAQLEMGLACAELNCTHLEQIAILAKQKAAKLEEEAQIAKETLATVQHSMF